MLKRSSEEEETEANALREVQRIVAGAAGISNEIIDLRRANYEWHLWMAGSHNHVAVVVPVFETVALAAPGRFLRLAVRLRRRASASGTTMSSACR